ncbi:glycoside hydrolase family 13 protein [Lachnoclostridium sp. Marseille-P6806]|uniref:glycoside hydrolase family 13 protein n=1 Tax=Lachnoclostridium sp. Marseille-P6806 TaxID=2364793 RepID=UPI00102F3327|nr:glycoside hydrolase family 13 protein [Lachnoclostridium sp. Marseille-P6806]
MNETERKALFCDYTSDYVEPWQPMPGTRVTIRLRTWRAADCRCFLVIRGRGEYPMVRGRENGSFAWYEAAVMTGEERLSWHFRVEDEAESIFFTRRGEERKLCDASWWNLIPGFRTPEWAVGAVMYQIYVDRFCNGDRSNDVLSGEYQYVGAQARRVEDWNRLPQADDIRDFYGGDLQGVMDRLDYLAELGIEAIYLNPLFVSPSNHKYDSQDYEHIDPHYGRIVRDGGELLAEGETDNRLATRYILRTTDPANLEASDALFAQLVEEAHRRGIRVIIDGVFNHCGSFHRCFDREGIYERLPGPRGAYTDEKSPFRSWFAFRKDKAGQTRCESWWGYDTLPKLNYENAPELEEYIFSIGRKWVSAPYGADGWRLDVAADLGHSLEYNHSFWRRFREAVREANPEAVVLAEHYGDSSPWLQGGEWDTIMNYDAFMEPVTWFLTGMEKHSDSWWPELMGDTDSFWKRMTYFNDGEMCAPPIYISMNELSNHDHSRFLTRTNHAVGRVAELGSEAAERNVNKAVFREAVVLQMTWPGAPTIYYGDEAGLCGFTDPDNRRSYPWGREDKALIAFHRELIRIRRENPCLRTGALRQMAAEQGVIGYARFDRSETLLILVNNNETERTLRIEALYADIPADARLERLLLTEAGGFSCAGEGCAVQDGILEFTLPGTAAIILRWKNDSE